VERWLKVNNSNSFSEHQEYEQTFLEKKPILFISVTLKNITVDTLNSLSINTSIFCAPYNFQNILTIFEIFLGENLILISFL